MIEGGSCAVRVNTKDGKFDVLEFTDQNWVKHPKKDDVAVCPMPSFDNSKFKARTVGTEIFLTKTEMTDLNIGPGDDVFLSGRFVNSEGKQRNMPTLRFGNIAQMPFEPIAQRRVWGQHLQESFFVEARAISGFSGSPVFLMLLKTFSRQNGKPPSKQDIVRLLGIVWGYITDWQRVCDEHGNELPNKWMTQVNTGMMGVVPAWQLQELLDLPELKKNRQEQEEAWLRSQDPTASQTTSAATA